MGLEPRDLAIVGACVVSAMALIHTIATRRYDRKYEAAKRRTELLSKLNMSLRLMESMQITFNSIHAYCKDCEQSLSAEMVSGNEETIQCLKDTIKTLESLGNMPDPIQLELIIPKGLDLLERNQRLARNVERIFTRSKECSQARKSSTPHILLPGDSASESNQPPKAGQ